MKAGFRCHSGWAVMVVTDGTLARPLLIDRRRVELVGPGLPRQPYHAVAEEGAPRSIISRVEKAANKAISSALLSLPELTSVALVAKPRDLPDDLDQILRSHPRLHAAEGWLYERAVLDAATSLDFPVTVIAPDTISISPALEAAGRAAGPPWQKDHKWAAAAALTPRP